MKLSQPRIVTALIFIVFILGGCIYQPPTLTSVANYKHRSIEYLNYNEIAIKDNIAFISVRKEGILILDITQVSKPRVVNLIPNPSSNLYINGDLLFVTDIQGFSIYNISDLENINLISTYPKEGRLNFVVSRKKIYLYGRNFELPPTGSLDILEIDDKGQINVIQENIKNIGTPVAIRDDILFVSMDSIKDGKFNDRLTVLGLNSQGMISDKKDTVDYKGIVSLQFDEHYGYIADGFIGLVFFETSPNGKIIELGSYGSYGSPTCLGLDYPYVYIGSDAGIEIIDISDIKKVKLVAMVSDIKATDIKIVGEYVFVTTWLDGLIKVYQAMP